MRGVPDWVWSHAPANRRRALWRAEAFMLDDECPGCGVIMHDGGSDDDSLCTVDHVVPRALDGADDPSNWGLLCHLCNQTKGDSYPDDRD